MTRRFEFKDAKSNKYWEITIKGETITVRYGRIGTDGQMQTKAYGTPAEAKAAIVKQIAEKVKKGYQEVDGEENYNSRKAAAKKATRATVTKDPAGINRAPESDESGPLKGQIYATTSIGKRLFGGIVFFETDTHYYVVADAKDEFLGESGFPYGSPEWPVEYSKKTAGYRIGKYSDWRLPSVIELGLIDKYVNAIGVAQFEEDWYWSEDQYDEDTRINDEGDEEIDEGDAVPCYMSDPALFKSPDIASYRRDVARATELVKDVFSEKAPRGTRLRGRVIRDGSGRPQGYPDAAKVAERNIYSGARELLVRLVRVESKSRSQKSSTKRTR